LQHPLRVRCVSLTRGWNLAVLPWSAADPYQSPEIFRFFYDTQRRKRETEQRTQWKQTLPQSPVHNASTQQKIVASNGCKCSPRTHRRDCARARKSSCKNLDITYMYPTPHAVLHASRASTAEACAAIRRDGSHVRYVSGTKKSHAHGAIDVHALADASTPFFTGRLLSVPASPCGRRASEAAPQR